MDILTRVSVLSRFGHALSDPTRTQVLLALKDTPRYPAELADALRLAKRVVVAGIAKLEQIPADERLDPAKLIEDIRSTGAEAEYIPTADEIVEHVVGQAKEGDILCVLSNGGFGGIHQKLLDSLAR